MRLKIKENKLILEIDGIDIELIFTLGVGIELEKKYDTIDEIYKNIKKISVCVDITVAMVNEAIKKYNREYNESIKPINSDWVGEQELNNFLNINNFKIAVINGVLDSNKGAEGKKTGNNKKKQG